MSYFLTAAAVCLNEVRYIQEWIEFHKLQGIEHFFIIDNGSTDGTQDILQHYQEEGEVTWVENRMVPVQLAAYNIILKEHGPKTEWMAFIDIDEFLYCPEESLINFFKDVPEDIGGYAARWYLYGSSGERNYKSTLVTERFLRRSNTVNRHCKSIVRPEAVQRAGRNSHVFYMKPGFKVINEDGKVLPTEYATIENEPAERIRINHYHVKSYGEYVDKRKKPRPSTGTLRPQEQMAKFFAEHDRNEVFDPTASFFVNQIQKAIWDESKKMIEKRKHERNHIDNPHGQPS